MIAQAAINSAFTHSGVKRSLTASDFSPVFGKSWHLKNAVNRSRFVLGLPRQINRMVGLTETIR